MGIFKRMPLYHGLGYRLSNWKLNVPVVAADKGAISGTVSGIALSCSELVVKLAQVYH